VLDDDQLQALTCSGCGSSLNLLPDEAVIRHFATRKILGRFQQDYRSVQQRTTKSGRSGS
jgi:hypothetical protein